MDSTVLEKILRAVANKRRIEILRYLQVRERAPVIDIARNLHLTIQTTSKHLAILYSQGIVERNQRSIYMYYSVAPTQNNIVRYILDNL